LSQQVPDAFARAGVKVDSATVTCLRSVLMKPEHADWVDRIWDLLGQSL